MRGATAATRPYGSRSGHFALAARGHGLTVADAVERLLKGKRAAGLSKRHLYTVENRLNRFAGDHAGRPLASFNLREIEQWINGLPVGAQSANHFKAVLHSLFGYGVKLGACVANPVAGIDSRKVVRPAPSILTPGQLAGLLTASEKDTQMQAFFLVAAFAGLRTAEIERLKWEDVNLRRGFITVGAQSAKTAKCRCAPRSANGSPRLRSALAQWLQGLTFANTSMPFAEGRGC